MPNHREAELEARLRTAVRAMGGLTEKLAPTRWGIPDRLVFLPFGQIYLIELKAETGRVRPTQALWHQRVKRLGTEVVVLRGMVELERWLGEQSFILRKKLDAAVASDSAPSARPYRVEQLNGDGKWTATHTYKTLAGARVRVAEIQADGHPNVRIVYQGQVVDELYVAV